jgi:hypothetical protein
MPCTATLYTYACCAFYCPFALNMVSIIVNLYFHFVAYSQVAANAGIHAIDFRAGTVAWACDAKTHSPQVLWVLYVAYFLQSTGGHPNYFSQTRRVACNINKPFNFSRSRAHFSSSNRSNQALTVSATMESCAFGIGVRRNRCKHMLLTTAGTDKLSLLL